MRLPDAFWDLISCLVPTGGLVVRSKIVSSVVWFPCGSVASFFVSAFSAVLVL